MSLKILDWDEKPEKQKTNKSLLPYKIEKI